MIPLLMALAFLTAGVQAAPAAAPATVAKAPAPVVKEPVIVKILWDYKGFPGPMAIHEVKGKPRLWSTRSVPSLQSTPVGKAIDSSAFPLRPGHRKRFALVFRNDSDSAIYFFAAPHTVHPIEHSLGFKFKCLCINHAFLVGPKETWYRIVDFHLSRDFVGNDLTVNHTLIGIDSLRAIPFSKEPAQTEP